MFSQYEKTVFSCIKNFTWPVLAHLLEENPSLIYLKDAMGNTPLHYLYALNMRETEVANMILHKDPDYLETVTNDNNETPLDIHAKVQNNYPAVFAPMPETMDRYKRMLLGANVTSARALVNFLIRVTGESPINYNEILSNSFLTAIHDSFIKNKKEAIDRYADYLFELSAKLNVQDAKIYSILISYIDFQLHHDTKIKKYQELVLRKMSLDHLKANDTVYRSELLQIKSKGCELIYDDIINNAIEANVLEEYIRKNHPHYLEKFLTDKDDFFNTMELYKKIKNTEKENREFEEQINKELKELEATKLLLDDVNEKFIADFSAALNSLSQASVTEIVKVLLAYFPIEKTLFYRIQDGYYSVKLNQFFQDDQKLTELAEKIHSFILNSLVSQWFYSIPLDIWAQDLTLFAKLLSIAHHADDVAHNTNDIMELTTFIASVAGDKESSDTQYIYKWFKENFNLDKADIDRSGQSLLIILSSIVSEAIAKETITKFQNEIKQEIICLHNLNEAYSPFVYRGYNAKMSRAAREKLMSRSVNINVSDRTIDVNLGGEMASVQQSSNLTISNLTTPDLLTNFTADGNTIFYHTGFDDSISFTELLNVAASYAGDQGCISIAYNTVGIDLDLYLVNVVNQQIEANLDITGDVRERAFKNLDLESYVCNFQISQISTQDTNESPDFLRYEIVDPILSDSFKKGLLPLSAPKDKFGFYLIPFFLINACISLYSSEGKRFYIEVAPNGKQAILRLIEQTENEFHVVFSTDNEFDNPQYHEKIYNQFILNNVFSTQYNNQLSTLEKINLSEHTAISLRCLAEQLPELSEQQRNTEVNRMRWLSKGVGTVIGSGLFDQRSSQSAEKNREKGDEPPDSTPSHNKI